MQESHHGSPRYSSTQNCTGRFFFFQGWVLKVVWLCLPTQIMALTGDWNHRMNGALLDRYWFSSVALTTIYTDFQFSGIVCQKDKNRLKRERLTILHFHIGEKKDSDVQCKEKPGADWRRLSGLQGQRFMSEEVKVRTKLAYLCKLKLSCRTMDGWFQLKSECVTERPLGIILQLQQSEDRSKKSAWF